MNLDAADLDALSRIAREILGSLESISTRARDDATGSTRTPDSFLSDQGRRAQAQILSANAENLEKLYREPAIARIVFEWLDDSDAARITSYVCRGSAAGLDDALQLGRLVSYKSALGRLAEFEAGDQSDVQLPGGPRSARILEREQFRSFKNEKGWDARDNTIEFLDSKLSLDSLRQFLVSTTELGADEDVEDIVGRIFSEAAEAEAIHERRRRRVIDKIALRDQPILDQYQGEVFRLPLTHSIFLLGRPGTGKTTTLIRRLAQKRTVDALTEDELGQLHRYNIQNEFFTSHSWAMYAPTDLLKLYLRNAFNRENVPATETNLRTWEKERTELARNTFRILRGAGKGRYTPDESEVLSDTTSPTLSRLFDAFSDFVETETLDSCTRAIESLADASDTHTIALADSVRSRFGRGSLTLSTVYLFAQDESLLAPTVGDLSRQIQDSVKRHVNELLQRKPELLPNIVGLLDSLDSFLEEDDPEDEEEIEDGGDEGAGTDTVDRDKQAADLLLRTVRNLAVGATRGRRPPRGRIAAVIELLGDLRPQARTLIPLGERILRRRHLNTLRSAARRFVFGIPQLYTKFRAEATKKGQWFRKESVRRDRISSLEVDVLILGMLRNSRIVAQNMPGTSWLEAIEDRRLMQVFVDEATDFSAVQLACMAELSHRRLRALFASGDFRQRITPTGLRTPDEIDWLERCVNLKIENRSVNIDYRQAEPLRSLAQELLHETDVRGDDKAIEVDRQEVLPLLAENLDGTSLAMWLAERISEIESAIGEVPSIAIFVDGDAHIDPLVEVARPLFSERSLQIIGCKGGRDIGDAQEIRVFDIQHIKGLEFEAVFFVGVDSLAKRLPDLFERYLYVGVTRAATYLAVTCKGALPSQLEPVRPFFLNGDWLN